MSALPSPIAPSSMPWRIAARIESSLFAGAAPMRIPIAYSRIVLAPTKEPTLGEIPCACIARSHASKPCAPWNGLIIASIAVSDALSASVSALTGATVYASPRISVVTPCVSLPTSRPSPRRNRSPDCPWMSMKPGATTIPVASMRFAAVALPSCPGRTMRAMRSPLIARSA